MTPTKTVAKAKPNSATRAGTAEGVQGISAPKRRPHAERASRN